MLNWELNSNFYLSMETSCNEKISRRKNKQKSTLININRLNIQICRSGTPMQCSVYTVVFGRKPSALHPDQMLIQICPVSFQIRNRISTTRSVRPSVGQSVGPFVRRSIGWFVTLLQKLSFHVHENI